MAAPLFTLKVGDGLGAHIGAEEVLFAGAAVTLTSNIKDGHMVLVDGALRAVPAVTVTLDEDGKLNGDTGIQLLAHDISLGLDPDSRLQWNITVKGAKQRGFTQTVRKWVIDAGLNGETVDLADEPPAVGTTAIGTRGLRGFPVDEVTLDGTELVTSVQGNEVGRVDLAAVIYDGLVDSEPVMTAASAAAAEAVDEYVDGLDVVDGSDERILNDIDNEDWAIPFTDVDGYVSAGVRPDGSFDVRKWQPESVTEDALTGKVLRAVGDDNWAIPFYDVNDYIVGGVKPDATWSFLTEVDLAERAAISIGNTLDSLTRSSVLTWTVNGDSLSQGYDTAGGDWLLSEAWPALLQGLLTGVSIDNQAHQGWTVDEINIQQGSLPLEFTISGGSIPASGAVTVTTATVIGWRSGSTRNYLGALDTPSGRVPGTFTHTSGNVLQFTRTTAGSAISVPGTAAFIPDTDIHRAHGLFVYMGRNDVSLSTVGAHSTVEDHVVTRTREAIDYLTPQIKRFLVVGTINATTEAPGSDNYGRVTYINESLKALYPNQFFDLRRYLIDEAIYDAGLTPDSTDLANMASDRIPPQIMADSIHYKKLVAPLIAAQFKTQMELRGWTP